MFGTAIWDKLLKCIVGNSEIAWVKEGNFKVFKNHDGDLSQKLLESNMWLLPNQSNNHFGLKLISFNSGQLQISEWAIRKQLVITR